MAKKKEQGETSLVEELRIRIAGMDGCISRLHQHIGGDPGIDIDLKVREVGVWIGKNLQGLPALELEGAARLVKPPPF